jgi:hypothetical protein
VLPSASVRKCRVPALSLRVSHSSIPSPGRIFADGDPLTNSCTVFSPSNRKPVLAPLIAGNLVSDAHLAAIALEHGATVYSTDHDFARFPGVAHVNPLA